MKKVFCRSFYLVFCEEFKNKCLTLRTYYVFNRIETMKNKILLVVSIVAVLSMLLISPVYASNSRSEAWEMSPAVKSPDSISVKIVSLNGDLVISAEKNIKQVEVFSAIGGLLFSTKYDYTEIKISNLPKTVLVVRITLANQSTVIYKIKHN